MKHLPMWNRYTAVRNDMGDTAYSSTDGVHIRKTPLSSGGRVSYGVILYHTSAELCISGRGIGGGCLSLRAAQLKSR